MGSNQEEVPSSEEEITVLVTGFGVRTAPAEALEGICDNIVWLGKDQ